MLTRALGRLLPLIIVISNAQAVTWAVTWEEQAERLANVGASILDTFPIEEPLEPTPHLGIKTIVSFPPNVNSTVGTKNEAFPDAPIQTIPTIDYETTFTDFDSILGMRIWFGFLPPGTEKLFGISASILAWTAGISFQYQTDTLSDGVPYFALGYQRTHGNVSGTIASTSGDDEFSSQTNLIYGGAGLMWGESGLFFNLLTFYKSTSTTLVIADDATNLSFSDSLGDGPFPFGFQFTAGIDLFDGLTLTFSEVLLFKRLLMPRVGIKLRIEL